VSVADHPPPSGEPFRPDLQRVRPIERPPAPPLAGYGPLAFVARGGSGSVYRATRTRNHDEVAVKILDAGSQRHERELEALRRLEGSPHLMQVLDQGVLDDGRFWLALPFASLGSTERLLQSGPVSPSVVATIGMQAAEGLAAAHAGGVIHCDVKPSNLLMTADGSIQVSDFGVARVSASSTSHDTTSMTLLYTAPEVLEGSQPDERSDIYSLGLTLTALLAGCSPFQEEAGLGVAPLVDRICGGPPAISSVPAPEWLSRILERCTAIDPAERYPSMGEVRRALLDRAAPPRNRRRARTAFTALGISFLALGAVFGATGLTAYSPQVEVAGATRERESDPPIRSTITPPGGALCEPASGTIALSAPYGTTTAALELNLPACVNDAGAERLTGSLGASGEIAGPPADPLNCGGFVTDGTPTGEVVFSEFGGDIEWNDGTLSKVLVAFKCNEIDNSTLRFYLRVDEGRFRGQHVTQTLLSPNPNAISGALWEPQEHRVETELFKLGGTWPVCTPAQIRCERNNEGSWKARDAQVSDGARTTIRRPSGEVLCFINQRRVDC
jgi:hypothetical protein